MVKIIVVDSNNKGDYKENNKGEKSEGIKETN